MAGVDSRKGKSRNPTSRSTYPEDSQKTELIETLKYFLLDLPSESPHCDLWRNQLRSEEVQTRR